jgi:hypothetical protein
MFLYLLKDTAMRRRKGTPSDAEKFASDFAKQMVKSVTVTGIGPFPIEYRAEGEAVTARTVYTRKEERKEGKEVEKEKKEEPLVDLSTSPHK